MAQLVVFLLGILYSVAVLVLISAGLGIIFGMMRVINLAHGEFLVLGGYCAITAHSLGLNIWLSMLLVAPLVVGLFGILVERLIIRTLYGKLINTMLATWGLSLIMVGGMTMIFGNTTTGIPLPIGGFSIGGYQVSGYSLLLIALAAALVFVIWLLLSRTRFGLIARGTMQNRAISAAFGVNSGRVYSVTFACGSALAGLGGGVLAPLVGLTPGSGANYIAKAFITVISGGTSVVTGLVASAGLFGVISQVFTVVATPIVGELALLAVALLLLRMLPSGISGRYFRNWT
ncbi:MAG: ABC transporter permease subunit [bacterium]